MIMFLPTSIVTLVVWAGLLAMNVNILLAFVLALLAQVATASIVTKIYLGHWNPF